MLCRIPRTIEDEFRSRNFNTEKIIKATREEKKVQNVGREYEKDESIKRKEKKENFVFRVHSAYYSYDQGEGVNENSPTYARAI